MDGAETIAEFDPKAFLKTLTTRPGVYRMIDGTGTVIYVGKARNLRQRVSSYFRRQDNAPKTRAMVSQIRDVQVTVTRTENEALILENNLIKELRPRYNVLLRDDKSYPYIHVSDEPFPRLGYVRGRKRKGRYFGPYPSAGAAKESLHLLQKIFRIRDCRNSYFRNRTRPCLQHQIDRCTAPCVNLIDEAGYGEDVRHAVMVLEGKDNQVIEELARHMEAAAAALDFELAARYRDQIGALRRVQEAQYVSAAAGDLDVIAAASESGMACIQLFMIRGGRNLGNKTFFPKNAAESATGEVLGAFIAQHYLGGTLNAATEIPPEVLVSGEIEDQDVLASVLSEQAGRKVAVTNRVRGDRARWVEMALTNAGHALAARLASEANLRTRFEALREALGMKEAPQRIECFDISHTMGEATVASCVVFGPEGAIKSDYRRFNIEGVAPGDDYGAMHQALERRFKRLKAGEGKRPDLLLIDGGRGQVAQAREVLDALGLSGILVVGVAKGESRKPGLETLVLPEGGAMSLAADSSALHLIQQVRDEAHRFAITGHRQRRGKARRVSSLEGIPGLGPKRRQQLLRQFGGLQEVQRAGVEELARVPGISRQLAQRIYDRFHPVGS